MVDWGNSADELHQSLTWLLMQEGFALLVVVSYGLFEGARQNVGHFNSDVEFPVDAFV